MEFLKAGMRIEYAASSKGGSSARSKASGPLAGIKVVELGQLIVGPFASKTLAGFGAEMIKVEPPTREGVAGGEPLRHWRLLKDGTSVW